MKKLGNACNISERKALDCIIRLESRGLIKRIGAEFGGQGIKGNNYRVFVPGTSAQYAEAARGTDAASRASAARRSDNKENLKRKYLKIAAELSESYVGAHPDQLKAAVRRRIEHSGEVWHESIWTEIAGA